jgi:hypothetical protein
MARSVVLVVSAALAATALVLAGCDEKKAASEAPPEAALPEINPSLSAKTEAFQPDGSPEAMKPATENGLQAAASVVELTYLQKQGDLSVKLFGTAGGDPAMNGLYTYVAFFVGSANGWRVFKLGDFLEYRVVHEEPGRVDLELKESVMNDSGGEISSRLRRVILTWDFASGGEPEVISVTPAK